MNEKIFEEYIEGIMTTFPDMNQSHRRVMQKVGYHQQKKIQELEEKLEKAVEYNKTFLGYALADRYQWDNDFLVEVGKHIKTLEAIEKGE